MTSEDSLSQIDHQLTNATSHAMIFGVIPASDEATMQERLDESFRYLVKLAHPDKAPERLKKLANTIFARLTEAKAAAEKAIKEGTYNKAFAKGAASVAKAKTIIQSPLGTYQFDEEPFKYGSFSAIYKAVASHLSGKEVLVKIASDPTTNPWLEREAVLLDKLTKDTKLTPFLPKIIDHFIVSSPDHRRYRVLVMEYRPELVSVADIIEAHPGGLNPQDAAWVCRRIISQAMAAAKFKIVHGAIIPDHVLVDPIKHEPVHIGWAHSVDHKKDRITHMVTDLKDFYPPEVLNKEKPSEATDIFMAGKTMIALVGGDVKTNKMPKAVPAGMAKVLLKCVDPIDRFDKSIQAFEALTAAVRAEWGRQYRPLVLPVR